MTPKDTEIVLKNEETGEAFVLWRSRGFCNSYRGAWDVWQGGGRHALGKRRILCAGGSDLSALAETGQALRFALARGFVPIRVRRIAWPETTALLQYGHDPIALGAADHEREYPPDPGEEPGPEPRDRKGRRLPKTRAGYLEP